MSIIQHAIFKTDPIIQEIAVIWFWEQVFKLCLRQSTQHTYLTLVLIQGSLSFTLKVCSFSKECLWLNSFNQGVTEAPAEVLDVGTAKKGLQSDSYCYLSKHLNVV